MDLYIQFGYGMMAHCKELIKKWNSGTIILSPRDQEKDQMDKFVKDIHKINGEVLFDPQFYAPHADHSRLIRHEFWPDDYDTAFFSKSRISEMIRVINTNYNEPYNTKQFIIPAKKSSIINEAWYSYYSTLIDESKKIIQDKEIFITLCLSEDAMMSEEAIHNILEYAESWEVDGFYIVPEPPKNEYLIDDPNWLINLMDLCAGLKLLENKIIVGYSNHQQLNLGLAKVDAICSGNWLNVRSFSIDRFNNPIESQKRKSTWYYCPQTLSEYQIPFLDIAYRLGMLEELKTQSPYNSNYSSMLFEGAQPTSVNFGERESFRHYLNCLKIQSNNIVKQTYEDTKNNFKLQLQTASNIGEYLQANGIRGKNRDFINVVDNSIAAADVFDRLRGTILSHNWKLI